MGDRSVRTRWGRGLRREDAAEYLGLSGSMLDKARKEDPTFPKPVPLVGSVEAWDREALDRWFEDRKATAEMREVPASVSWVAP
ncbi:AlpA family phage regulatory protein [Roseomonas terrae]|uniref:AlpA family phage regulatory protein n=1 Tax=Neoroseomonas terrae TaxID=424799 RepID=A0ABS5EJI4_9PROT|nr:AlpA family phage regulatory protein [Neoroseomonas terrae]MBR0651186.1 AlpA family phage regulatory protein [Neoroseomonas terrae]